MNNNHNNLETLREINNLKAKDIAEKLNIYKSVYSEWENNKTPIPTRRLIELANIYQINIDYLLNLTNKKITITNDFTTINLKEIGLRLKSIRTYLNLSLRDLGDKLNCSFSAFAAYERGEKLINSEILVSFAILSNYSIDYILGRTSNKYLLVDKKKR